MASMERREQQESVGAHYDRQQMLVVREMTLRAVQDLPGHPARDARGRRPFGAFYEEMLRR
jgi:hypothetical protein